MSPRLTGSLILAVAAFSLACAGGGYSDTGPFDYYIEGLTIERDGLNYATITGVIEMQESTLAGTYAEVEFYSDEYSTLIVDDTEYIGGDLDDVGDRQEFEMSHYEVYVVPATSGYEKVCALFRADDTQYEEWTEVGCLQ